MSDRAHANRKYNCFKTKKFAWNFETSNSKFFVQARKKGKKIIQTIHFMYFLQVDKENSRRMALSLSPSLSELNAESVYISQHAKRVKSFKLEIFRREKRLLLERLHFLCIVHSTCTLWPHSSTLLLLLLFDARFVSFRSDLSFFEFVPFCLFHDFLIPLLYEIDNVWQFIVPSTSCRC